MLRQGVGVGLEGLQRKTSGVKVFIIHLVHNWRQEQTEIIEYMSGEAKWSGTMLFYVFNKMKDTAERRR